PLLRHLLQDEHPYCLCLRYHRIPRPRISTLFPYTTLFRSLRPVAGRSVLSRCLDRLLAGGAAPLVLATTTRAEDDGLEDEALAQDRKSTRLNSSHVKISYAVCCLKKKKK